MKKVSVIVPVYNVQDYLEECLNSLAKQTLKDIEIIVVNDGSTDRSLEMIEEYKNMYDNIKVINQENSGLSAARNSGLKNASGKYIMFIDSDDFIDLDMIERMYNKAEKYDCPLIICDLVLYWSDKKYKKYNNLNEKEEKIYSTDELYKILLSRKLNCQVVNKLYRRDIWEKNQLTFEDGRYYEDIVPSFKIVDIYKKIMFINDSMYKYRMRDGAITASSSSKKVLDLIEVVESARNYALANTNCCNIDKYIMSFNVNYGLYAVELNNLLKKDECLINEIKEKIKLDYKIYEVIFNNKINLKSKIKFILMKFNLKFKE